MCILDKNDFVSVYHGINTCCEIKGLQPNTCYSFRIQASNAAGSSEYSSVGQITTPPSAPAVIGCLRYEATSNSLSLSWTEPLANGSDITHYNIDIGDKIVKATTTEHILSSLRPETTYRHVYYFR